jgi:hypothetical protein
MYNVYTVCTGLTTKKKYCTPPSLKMGGNIHICILPHFHFLSRKTYLPVFFLTSTLLSLWKYLSACPLPYFHSPFSLETSICLFLSLFPLSFLSGNIYLPVFFPTSTLLSLCKYLSVCLLPYFPSSISLEIPICLSLFLFPLSFLSGNTYLPVPFPYFHSPFSVAVSHPTTLFSAYSDLLRLLFLLFLHVPLQNFA